MARLAERAKVGLRMSTATVSGNHVMNLISGDVKATFKTVFAKRMSGNIPIADSSPSPTVNAVVVGGASVAVVLTGGDGFMCIAVASSTDEFGATTISTGFKRFQWHLNHQLSREGGEDRVCI